MVRMIASCGEHGTEDFRIVPDDIGHLAAKAVALADAVLDELGKGSET
jgi:hypothetical protein